MVLILILKNKEYYIIQENVYLMYIPMTLFFEEGCGMPVGRY
jgi:hypothetical protein